MDSTDKFRKRLLIVLALFVVLFIASFLWSLRSMGKTSVTVTVIPEDSKITINDKGAKAGNNLLTPGVYTFTASKEGFKTDSYTVEVKEESVRVNLLPVADSSEAKEWLKNNPQAAQEREALMSERTNTKGLALQEANPLIKELPYRTLEPVNGVFGPFSIDYGPSQDRVNGVVIIVSSVSPKGRQNALTWIRNKGYNPVDYQIIFPDYPSLFADIYEENVINEEEL